MAHKNHYQILIIGGGTGGIMTSAKLLRERKGLDIGLIEPSDKHIYQPALTLVGAGTYKAEKIIRPENKYIPKGVDWIKDYATNIDPDTNTVGTRENGDITYDYLIVATGIKIELDKIEGLKETLGRNNVCSNYVDAKYTWEVLRNFKGGNAIFTQPATPIKCGGAPQKIMYLTADYLRRHHLSDKSNVMFVTPGTVIFGVEIFAKRLLEICDRYNIAQAYYSKPVKIDGPNKLVTFEMTGESPELSKVHDKNPGRFGVKTEGKRFTVPFDMLHLAPPQGPPDLVANSKIAHQDGDMKGWVEVDIHTLQHKRYPNVFCVGDSAGVPTARTGAAIRKQVPVAVANLLKVMDGDNNLVPGYNGYSSCPIVTAYGKMLLAEFDYQNNHTPDPTLSKFLDLTKEHKALWILKKYGLPWLYWNMMLKGKMM